MIFDKKDVDSWKTSLRDYDIKRKSPTHERVERNKVVTHREVKLKDVEFNPILSVYSDKKREEATQLRESQTWKQKAEDKNKRIEKYDQGYDIITNDKVGDGPIKNQEDHTRGRILPAAQVDYNILTNEKLDEVHFKNGTMNVNLRKKNDKKTLLGTYRDFNIVSNEYYKDHKERFDKEYKKNEDELEKKRQKVQNYNAVKAEFYDPVKEKQYQDKVHDEMKKHGKEKLEKLPPSIKNREMLIFDHSKDIPEEVKILDHKKEMAKKRFKLKYKLENEYKERDYHNQDVEERRTILRQNDKKYTEHLLKGYDVITHEQVPTEKINYELKPHLNRWDQLMVESQTNFTKAKTANNTPHYASVSGNFGGMSGSFVKPAETVVEKNKQRDLSMKSFDIRNDNSATALNFSSNRQESNTGAKLPQYYDSLKIKDPIQRAKEPAFNYADKYNAYVRQPEIKKEYQSNILPTVPNRDSGHMNFSVTATGGFKRSILG